MSGGKSNGVAHQVMDLVRKIEAQQNGRIAEIAKRHNDLAAAITAMEQMLKQVAGFTASEMGKFQGETASRLGILARSVDGVDLNVLALAEMAKEMIGQLAQVDTVFKKVHDATRNLLSNQYGGLSDDGTVKAMTPEMIQEFKNVLELSEGEIANVRTEASEWYKRLVMSAFKTVQERRAAAEKEAVEAEMKAKEEAKVAAEAVEKAEQDKQESTVMNEELKAASEAERTVVATKSGGPGSEFPEGADIFGG